MATKFVLTQYKEGGWDGPHNNSVTAVKGGDGYLYLWFSDLGHWRSENFRRGLFLREFGHVPGATEWFRENFPEFCK